MLVSEISPTVLLWTSQTGLLVLLVLYYTSKCLWTQEDTLRVASIDMYIYSIYHLFKEPLEVWSGHTIHFAMNNLATWTPKFKWCSLGRTISYFVRFEMVFSGCRCPYCFSKPCFHWMFPRHGQRNGMNCWFSLSHSAIHFHPPQWASNNTICKEISPAVFLFPVFLKKNIDCLEDETLKKPVFNSRSISRDFFQKHSSASFGVRG